ncbi:MAG: Holliday junction resolvase RuvX [Actinobacteria bacterium]|nr:Holliday junction resolvase RuvX [Actinomycetota bacterium]
MKILGIDVGEKRIGLAIAEENNTIAIPFGVIENNNKAKDELKRILDDNEIYKAVVGIPNTLKGKPGKQAEKVFDFVEKNLRCHNIGIEFEDERFTSRIPERNMQSAVTGRGKSSFIKRHKNFKKHLDELSACIILEGFLKRKNIKY